MKKDGTAKNSFVLEIGTGPTPWLETAHMVRIWNENWGSPWYPETLLRNYPRKSSIQRENTSVKQESMIYDGTGPQYSRLVKRAGNGTVVWHHRGYYDIEAITISRLLWHRGNLDYHRGAVCLAGADWGGKTGLAVVKANENDTTAWQQRLTMLTLSINLCFRSICN